MKKSLIFSTLVTAMAALTAAPSFADTSRNDVRQQHQRERIENGVQSGELTRRETRRLAAGQVHLNRVERRVEADGVVNARERAHLRHETNQQSRRIHRQKHDGQSRRR